MPLAAFGAEEDIDGFFVQEHLAKEDLRTFPAALTF
jgi:hypothetical protein